MDSDALLQAIRESLLQIINPRFYETERGFQGQFLIELSKRIPGFLPDRAIVEQEYQKTLARHGLNIRPDVVIHQPFDPRLHASPREGNFAVIELKLRAGPKKAAEDFANLQRMLRVLHYPLGVFINIDHSRPHASEVPQEARSRIVCLATRLTDHGVRVVTARRYGNR